MFGRPHNLAYQQKNLQMLSSACKALADCYEKKGYTGKLTNYNSKVQVLEQKQYIWEAIRKANNVETEAAKLLGILPFALRKRLKKMEEL